MISTGARALAAEAAGTALLVGIGTGAIVYGASHGGVGQGTLAIAWFAAVTVPVLLFARTSGAHLNPAVTLSLALARRFPWPRVAPYVLAQVAGALTGSLVVEGLVGRAAHLGATVPAGIGLPQVFLLEFGFATALVLSVQGLSRRAAPPHVAWLLLPGTVVGVSTYIIGPLTGSSLNPARSLAPWLLSGEAAGWPAYLGAAILAAVGSAALARALDRSLGPAASNAGTP